MKVNTEWNALGEPSWVMAVPVAVLGKSEVLDKEKAKTIMATVAVNTIGQGRQREGQSEGRIWIDIQMEDGSNRRFFGGRCAPLDPDPEDPEKPPMGWSLSAFEAGATLPEDQTSRQTTLQNMQALVGPVAQQVRREFERDEKRIKALAKAIQIRTARGPWMPPTAPPQSTEGAAGQDNPPDLP